MSVADPGNLIGLGMAPALAGLVGGKCAAVTAAGSSISDATACTTKCSYVSGADGAKGVQIRATGKGEITLIKNVTNGNLLVYPPTGTAFNAGTANAAITVAAYTITVIICYASDNYLAAEIPAA